MPELFPYQREGAAFLAEKGVALLADEPGLGKTAQAIAATQDTHSAPDVVVVCPASVRENWYREFERFWSGLVSYNLKVESYDKVARGVLKDFYCDVLILDEAHYLKSRTAKRTQAVFGQRCDGKGGLVERANHVFLLTGTPMPNQPAELWPMLRALFPDSIPAASGKPRNYFQFVNKFCRTRNNGFGTVIEGAKNIEQLRAIVSPFTLRRKKEDVLKDLPPLRLDTLALDTEISLPPEVSELVPEIEAALDKDGIAGLAKLAPHVATLRRYTALAKVEPVCRWIKDWFEGGGGQLVVFAHHREVIDALFHYTATQTGLKSDRLTGATPADKRQYIVDRFQKGVSNVFFGQIQAAGTGITLTAASDALFVESSWVPAENEQAAMRIHRIGQREACLVRFAMIPGSIDERIQKAVVRKTADIVQLFG